MRLKSFSFIFLVILFTVIFLSNSGGRANMSDAGNTGAPCEDGQTCGSCHLGGIYGPVTEEFKLIDPFTSLEVNNYQPGKTYNVEVTVIPSLNAPRYGFQATALDTNNLDAGTWMNPSNVVQIAQANVSCGTGTRTYIEHLIPNFTKTFRVDWQAPTCDIGDVTFYYIGNAVNNNQENSFDVAGPGSSTVYPPMVPQLIVIDSSNIPSGIFIASSGISITGAVIDSNEITLAASDSLLINDTLNVLRGSLLIMQNDTCI